MAKRSTNKGTGARRHSFLADLLRQSTTAAAALPLAERPCLMEELEARVLLSAAPVATPDFFRYRPTGAAKPAASASPVGLTPAILRKAYGFDLAKFGNVVGDGAGQTIAIVDAYNAPTIVADLYAFDVQFGLADPPSFIRLSQTGTTTLPGNDPAGAGNSWALETSLDVEWAHAMAPKANIVLVEAKSSLTSDLFAAVNTARNYAGVSVVSMSWGGGESANQATYNQYFTTPAGHTGVTFIASSGDSGAYISGTTKGVEYPAASPNVLSVGGTYLVTDASGNYVSESGWGNSTSSAGSGGAGGGISKYTPQPAYQKGVVTQTTMYRAVPDVSFDADPRSGVAVYDTYDLGVAAWAKIGGTSLAAPLWAGVIAIADQGLVLAGQGTLDGATGTLPKIYTLPSKDFHDITTGNNGYAAGAGYDLVTGRGSPIVNLLVADLAGSVIPPPQPVPVVAGLTVNPGSVTAGMAVTLTATGVTETSGAISGVNFYLESNASGGLQIGGDTLVGAGVQSGTTWTISAVTAGLAPGSYTYYAVATDAASVTSNVVSTVVTVVAPAPANDNFASATVISGSSVTVTGTNVAATKETGEPKHAGNTGGKSVWWSWAAPTSGTVTLNTRGSGFDTLLAVYTGTAVSGLTAVASNDDAPGVRTSSVTFAAVAGVTYSIAVDGYNGASGAITLNLAQVAAPANNAFAAAAVVTGDALTWAGTNAGATRETGEPATTTNAGGASVWLAWTAPTTRTVSVNTRGSSYDTLLAVFTGTSVSTLTRLASNDDAAGGGTLTSALTFNAVAGTTYYFAIDGYNAATGSITFNLA
jgi:hypothetical protein